MFCNVRCDAVAAVGFEVIVIRTFGYAVAASIFWVWCCIDSCDWRIVGVFWAM